MAFVRSWPALWCALLLWALVVRLAAALWWEQRLEAPFGFGDSQSYWHLARSIARGEPYEFGSPDAKAFRTPGYPLVLAPLFLILGDQPAVFWGRAWGALLGTMAVGGVGWLGCMLFDRRIGYIAASLAACYPGAVALSIFILSEAPFCPLMLLQLTLWLLAQRTASRAKSSTLAALAGCAAGAATLMRPSWLLFTPLVALFAWLVSKPRAQQLRLAACTLLGLAVTMSPWWWRNTRAMGHFVPTSLQVGASWFDAWSPTATGASNLQPAEARAAELRAEGFPPGVNAEYEIDRRLRQEAWQWARQHPVRAFQLAAIKFARMWNIWPNEPAFQSVAIGSAIAISYAFVLLTSLAGTWQFRRLGWPVALLWTPAVYLSAIHMIFVGSIRYREPAMLPLMVLGAAWLVSRYQSSPTANHPISQSVGVQE